MFKSLFIILRYSLEGNLLLSRSDVKKGLTRSDQTFFINTIEKNKSNNEHPLITPHSSFLVHYSFPPNPSQS